jgi:ABC-type multidrug transport system fused ATPase/permease subunit
MHLNSGQVKFVAVDEPSSALDAEGEAQLFDRLLRIREGKTMVFVTHRFAHLTKFADVILFVYILFVNVSPHANKYFGRCMKDVSIAESGTHAELLQLGGEYSKLYDIQANAFDTSDICPGPTPSVSIPQ